MKEIREAKEWAGLAELAELAGLRPERGVVRAGGGGSGGGGGGGGGGRGANWLLDRPVRQKEAKKEAELEAEKTKHTREQDKREATEMAAAISSLMLYERKIAK
eukprot:g2122.t1